MGIDSTPSLLTRGTQSGDGVIVRDLGGAIATAAALTALVGTAVTGGTAPIIQGTNVIIIDLTEAANGVITFPLMPVGGEITFQFTAVNAGGGLDIQENFVRVQQRVGGIAANFVALATQVLTDANWTFGGANSRLSLGTTAGTAILTLKKIRPNSAAGTADGWAIKTFQRQ